MPSISLIVSSVRLPLSTSFREVNNVVTFSLKTAEQSLLEDHPDLHSKLVSGRVKRLKVLQDALVLKQKETDLRSLELCAENTCHLEDFQDKAKERLSVVTAEFCEAVEFMRSHLKLADTDIVTIQN